MAGSYRFALLGDPVSHSRSPAIHHEALRLSGLDGSYEAIRSDVGDLDESIGRLRSGDLDGVNITMPLKGAAARICDVLTLEATRSGSVNTLRYRNDQVEGHSTDVVAMTEILGSEGFRTISTVLILGAGGSARAALVASVNHDVYLSARRQEKSDELANGVEDVVVRWETAIAGAVVINATPIGMENETLPKFVVEVCGALIDLPYGESPTPAFVRAQELEVPVVGGIEFLARQAAASFKWWTDIDVELAPLIEIARKI